MTLLVDCTVAVFVCASSAQRLFDETPRSTCFAVIVLAEEFVFAAISSIATFAAVDFAIVILSSAAFSTTTFSVSAFSVVEYAEGATIDLTLVQMVEKDDENAISDNDWRSLELRLLTLQHAAQGLVLGTCRQLCTPIHSFHRRCRPPS